MKKVIFLIFCISFFSCSSNKFFIPGEKEAQIENISIEYFNIAEEYLNQKNYTKAIQYYKLVMKSDSLFNASYYKLGRCYALNKDYKNALSVYENILKNDPGNSTIKSSIAYLYAVNNNPKKALDIYSALLVENPNNEEVLVNYISILISQKDFETAKVNLNFLEEKFPSNKNIALFKSLIKENINDSSLP